MIELVEVIKIHKILIDAFGGTDGVRDTGLLESALQRPYMTFDRNELYPDPIKKSAAIIESCIKNHPFVDGNKRVGYVLMRLLLLENGLDINATEEEKYEFVLNIANGFFEMNDIEKWIKSNVIKLK